ncbi:MAG: aminoacetone oxidase family FAD-binding enzyme [Erysipelotrichales bacterium]|nr:aminoacetone oxidase family FAD-binding enzyme [Erysipelotrichales bacterium]
MSKVVVIGAGPSGIMAALQASKNNKVIIIEGNDKIGKKILVTGNGKCNFWNEVIDISKYNTDNKEKLNEFLSYKDKVYEYLTTSLGIYPFNKNGYIYPYSNTAVSINETFKNALEKENINIIYNLKVIDIEVNNDNVELVLNDNTKIIADKVIIATGSKASPKTGSDGSGYELLNKLKLNINPVTPALVPLTSNESFISDWANIRASVKLSVFDENLLIKEEYGEIQLTDYGISGIVTFNVSSQVQNLLSKYNNVNLYIDFLPNENNLLEFLESRFNNMNNPTIEEMLETIFNYKLMHVLLSVANINKKLKWNEINNKNELINTIKNFKIIINGSEDYEKAQVCHGGLSLNDIDETFKLKKYNNISVVGELLDVDGICGGYNLAFAFISGYIAGEHIND